ncbi:MAG: bestrophin family ion channel [Cyanophyceae cyanobacterium]
MGERIGDRMLVADEASEMLRRLESRPWFSWQRSMLQLRGSVLPSIWRRVLGMTLYSVVIVLADQRGYRVDLPVLGNLIPSIVLGLLLVFRTNTAYDRFWEGRKIWGSLLSTARLMVRNMNFVVRATEEGDRAEQVAYMRMVPALIASIKHHLRGEPLAPAVVARVVRRSPQGGVDGSALMPLDLMNGLADYFQRLYGARRIDAHVFVELNRHLDSLTLDLGRTQRILRTPLPHAYAVHLKHLLLIYCLTLPFQFVGALGWSTVPAVGIISFALLGIEEIGQEIENPFGYDANDLPLDEFCRLLALDVERLIEYGEQSLGGPLPSSRTDLPSLKS